MSATCVPRAERVPQAQVAAAPETPTHHFGFPFCFLFGCRRAEVRITLGCMIHRESSLVNDLWASGFALASLPSCLRSDMGSRCTAFVCHSHTTGDAALNGTEKRGITVVCRALHLGCVHDSLFMRTGHAMRKAQAAAKWSVLGKTESNPSRKSCRNVTVHWGQKTQRCKDTPSAARAGLTPPPRQLRRLPHLHPPRRPPDHPALPLPRW